jgi:hypothetical protein
MVGRGAASSIRRSATAARRSPDKDRKLLAPQVVVTSYDTLHRFVVVELNFVRAATTILVIDGAPGEELQVDTGWVYWVTLAGQKRRFRAWISRRSARDIGLSIRHWRRRRRGRLKRARRRRGFLGGVFKVVIPDNTRAIIATPDPLTLRVTRTFLDYTQACGFHIDPARVRYPHDKRRVERAVARVRTIVSPARC